jgi:uncharacterized MAPEG superfamily protein
VLVAAALPYLCTVLAKSGRQRFDNHNPREWLARQQGWRARAHAAQQNSWEAFAVFSAFVLIAHLAHGPQPRADMFAIAFIVARLIYVLCYVTDKALLRSLVWAVGMGLALAIVLAGA